MVHVTDRMHKAASLHVQSQPPPTWSAAHIIVRHLACVCVYLCVHGLAVQEVTMHALQLFSHAAWVKRYTLIPLPQPLGVSHPIVHVIHLMVHVGMFVRPAQPPSDWSLQPGS